VRQAALYLLVLVLVVSMLALVRHVARPTGLASMLTDTSSRKDLKIYYDESQEGLFVYGDGRLALQKYPTDGTVEDDGLVPTCTSTASQQEIESLVRLMIQRHFVELPQNGFPNYVGAAEAFPWHLHIIVISSKSTHGLWVFETGELNGRRESIPPDFAAVETGLRTLKNSMTGTPCPDAPKVKLEF
jgi:hypothetical protein